MIAVIADIHGNLWALEAVLAALDRLTPAQVIVGGDLALGGPRPAECVALIRRRGYPAIRGNTDEWLTGKPVRVTDGISWCAAQLSEDDRAFVAGLPFLRRMEGRAGAGDLVVVHATPWSISDVIREDVPEATLSRVFSEAGAAAVVFGHIHTPFVRESAGRLLVNAGSVGLPFDGDWRASFALLRETDGGWTAEIQRVPYDREAALAAARSGDNPEGPRWARRLKTASF